MGNGMPRCRYVVIRGDWYDAVGVTSPCRHVSTGYYKLTQRNRDNFEPGSVDVFTFVAPDVRTGGWSWQCYH